jgi:hypothetical protein
VTAVGRQKEDKMRLRAPKHVIVGSPVLRLGLLITGIISGLCIGGGIVAIIWNAASPTDLNFFGVTVTTGHVGVALTVLGMASIVVVVRSAYKHLVKLAELPNDRR